MKKVHSPNDDAQDNITPSAETMERSAQITHATNVALPGVGIAIDQLRKLMHAHDVGALVGDATAHQGVPFAEEGICFALLVQACGVAKANGWPIEVVAKALGQAWNSAQVTSENAGSDGVDARHDDVALPHNPYPRNNKH